MKTCSKCGETKPATTEFFPVCNRSKSGLSSNCKACRYLQNKSIRTRKQLFGNKNLPLPVEVNQLLQKHPRKRSLPHTLTYEQWQETLAHFNNSCAYCGSTEKMTLEHFVPKNKHGNCTKNNMLPACNRCNCHKGSSDFDVWYPKQTFYSEDRATKIIKYLGIYNI